MDEDRFVDVILLLVQESIIIFGQLMPLPSKPRFLALVKLMLSLLKRDSTAKPRLLILYISIVRVMY